MKKLLFPLVGGLILAATPANAAVNLIVNGSFEDGTNGWTIGGDVGGDGAPFDETPVVIAYGPPGLPYPAGAHGEVVPAPGATGNPGYDPVGDFGLYFVADAPNPAQTLSQTVSTFGSKYSVGFDYYLPTNGSNNPGNAKLVALVDGVQFAEFIASAQPAATWQHFSTTMILPQSTNVTFMFSYTASTFPAKDFVIDRAYLVQVPEPATWAMMVGGFGFLGTAVRRRRQTKVTFA